MEETAARLRSAGLRPTAPRVAVLAVLEAERQHLTADEVVRAARKRLGALSVQGAYDVLTALTSAGLLRRIEPAGSAARYEARVADNHHHIVCRSCGAMQDVDCAVGEAPCLVPSSAAGFVLDEAEVTWWGLCPDCHARQQIKSVNDDEMEESA
ncbi:Fur family transcriptional regulator [Motilibacter deserti]|uniref:Transcriptional repressor n=1 Tax=Motilibacter deserti TaxID=2714956 RepID=A0ABX0GWX8_9ACTN|nr:transcriptional repressor [Motilibacter deserti]